MGVRSSISTFLILVLCAAVLSEPISPNVLKKSRKKRRGCKCVHRYLNSVEKMIDAKIKEFKDVYLLPKLNERNNMGANRMRDAMLRLSGEVAETKNALRIMTSNMESMLGDLNGVTKAQGKLSSKVGRMAVSVANVSKYVDGLEDRIMAQTPVEASVAALTNISVSEEPKELPKQCQEVFDHGGMRFKGDYYIMIKPRKSAQVKVLCKMVNNSGWTVIQKRTDGSVDFFREWEDYRRGFGTLEGEFWLGLDNIHHLTAQEDVMLRIEMEDMNGQHYFAVYDHFKVDSHKEKFRLHVNGYHGNSGDSMTSLWENHDGMAFSTRDQDNDLRYYDSCANHYQGAWWFSNCFEAHLNGKYYHKGFHQNYFQRDGIQWNSIHMYSSLKAVQMMIKPTDSPILPPTAQDNEVTSNL